VLKKTWWYIYLPLGFKGLNKFTVDSYNSTYDQPNPDIFLCVAPVQCGSSHVPTTDTVAGIQYELSVGGVTGYNLDVGYKRQTCCEDHV